MRKFFRSWLHDESADHAPTDAVGLIAAERRSQIVEKGYTPEHDDRHGAGEFARAAEAYLRGDSFSGRTSWPWNPESFKPSTRVRDLVKAGALIAAEIDRLQRRG